MRVLCHIVKNEESGIGLWIVRMRPVSSLRSFLMRRVTLAGMIIKAVFSVKFPNPQESTKYLRMNING